MSVANFLLEILAFLVTVGGVVGCGVCYHNANSEDNNGTSSPPQQQSTTTSASSSSRKDERIVSKAGNKSGLVAASVVKPSPDFKVGLSLGLDKKTNQLVITRLSGLFAQTNLQIGMQVLQINGTPVGPSSSSPFDSTTSSGVAKEAAGVIAQAQHSVTVLAREQPPELEPFLAVAVVKPTPTTKVGLSMSRSSKDGGCLVVTRTSGLFAETELEPGMQVVQINGVDMDGMLLREVLNLISWAQGTVTVVAKRTAPEEEDVINVDPVKVVGKEEEEEFTSRTMDMSDPEVGGSSSYSNNNNDTLQLVDSGLPVAQAEASPPRQDSFNGLMDGLAAELNSNKQSVHGHVEV